MLDVSAAEFDEVVGEALDGVPEELTRLMDNVALFVEDAPGADFRLLRRFAFAR